jgi:hypothetical protein
MSFKGGKRRNIEESYQCLKDEIADEFRRHRYVFGKISDDNNRALYEKLSSGESDHRDYSTSLPL